MLESLESLPSKIHLKTDKATSCSGNSWTRKGSDGVKVDLGVSQMQETRREGGGECGGEEDPAKLWWPSQPASQPAEQLLAVLLLVHHGDDGMDLQQFGHLGTHLVCVEEDLLYSLCNLKLYPPSQLH